MASGIEAWLFGYAGTKLANGVLERLRGDKLTVDLRRATEKWAAQLPDHVALASIYALFPDAIADDELAERPALMRLRFDLRQSNVPTDEVWHEALLKQWRFVRANARDPDDFFQLPEAEARRHLSALAVKLHTVCSQHEALFRATTISLLRELLARGDGSGAPEEDVRKVLTADQKALLRCVYQHRGLCRIAAARGEYECLWAPGAVCDMQWGWERTPEECRRSGKAPGDRRERLRWIYVVKDLTEAGLFEAQAKGYYALTEQGWRVAHDLGDASTPH
ncbi:hypothetical protein [Salinisphaera hydrothermalis]|uniref:Uncharacterized protein n=1 Tax=Salinisphaera hydrothermalis (strain C41B8) TaxID=1304275 RepID=A0A084IMP0_SALHC|nr:hypothetical protein [Salinisphaera hydrothermalis]KEZ77974.1 hypothetical protein C41B8_06757 [Salinisphaera hydrothermalis C41B8]